MDRQPSLVVLGALGLATVAIYLAYRASSSRSTSGGSGSSSGSAIDRAPSTSKPPPSSSENAARALPAGPKAAGNVAKEGSVAADSGVAESSAVSGEGDGSRGTGDEAGASPVAASGGADTEACLEGEGGDDGAAKEKEEEEERERKKSALVARFDQASASAKAHFRAKRYSEAAEEYGIALSLCDELPASYESNRTALHNNRGAAFEKCGKYALALSDCSMCLARDTGHSLARLRKSRVLEALGRPMDALAEVCAHLLLERDRVQAKAALAPSEPITPPTPPGNLEGLLQKIADARADEVLLEREQAAAKEAESGEGMAVKKKPLMRQAVTELVQSFGSFRQLEKDYKGMQEDVLTREIQRGEDDEGGDDVLASPSSVSSPKVAFLLERGLLRLVKRNYEGSREDMSEAVELLCKLEEDAPTGGIGFPWEQEASLWEWQGTFLQLAGELDEAMKAYERCGACCEAVEEPVPADVLVKMAWVHMDKENTAEARAFFTRAMEESPHYGTPFAHRARLDAEAEGVEVVKAFLEKAIELNRQDNFAWEQLGRLYVQADDVVKAIATVEEGIKAIPNAAGLLTLKAELKYSMAVRAGDPTAGPEIVGLFDEAIKATPSNAGLYINKASFLLQMMADVGGAMEMLEKAVEVDPTSVSALVQLANLRIMVATTTEDGKLATELLNKAVKLCTTREELTETLSVLVATEGRFKGAVLLGRTTMG